ncbi:hypothetical protein BMS3Abin01_01273 [bacterium BMS3Abin01]|nr:hypothetical protein BMS3Abin01_01273 [bacterium BMS3Abin01]
MDDDGLGGGVGELSVTYFALSQGVFSRQALADIADEPDEGDGIASRVTGEKDIGLAGEHGAIFPAVIYCFEEAVRLGTLLERILQFLEFLFLFVNGQGLFSFKIVQRIA